jgi:outer membrane protein TolC
MMFFVMLARLESHSQRQGRVRRARRQWRPVVLAGLVLLSAGSVEAQEPLTLDQALRVARSANAHLPIASLNRDIAQSQLREAQARLWPRLLLDGDAHAGTPQTYATNDARLQLIGIDTLYDGGRLRGNIAVARRQVAAAGAGYRVVEKDVELAVRLRFSEAGRAATEIAARQGGLLRLQNYLALIQARRAAGQGVSGDLLRTRSRLADEEANIADAERRLDEAHLELNNLLGRAPRAPLTLAPLPPPPSPSLLVPDSMPGDTLPAPWLRTPEVRAAEASLAIARANIGLTRAERRPTLAVSADVGVMPVWGDTAGPALLNNGRGFGAEVIFSLQLPLWDAGIYRARLGQAQFRRQVAEDSATVVRRESRLGWSRAVAQLEDFYRVLLLRQRNVPLARDAYLQAESLYRGGTGTGLEVIDAYAAWINAQLAEADAIIAYRQAHAQLIRWGTS